MDIIRVFEFDFASATLRGPRALDQGSLDRFSARGPKRVSIGHLSDPHVGKLSPDLPRQDTLAWWIDEFKAAGVQVLVISGDLVERPGDEVGLRQVHQMLMSSGLPFVTVPGNHDKGPGGHGVFEAIFGNFPRLESHAGMRFLLLDSMAAPALEDRSQQELRDAERLGFFSSGALGAAQLRHAESLLEEAADEPTIMVVHHPLASLDPGAPASPTEPLLDAGELLELAARHQIPMILHGHHHPYIEPAVLGDSQGPGVLVLNGGSVTRRGFPKRARVIDFPLDPKQAKMTSTCTKFRPV